MTVQLAVVFTRRAALHVDEAGRWWRDNRPKAPGALHEELATALQLITAQPHVGATARTRRTQVDAEAPRRRSEEFLP